MQGIELLRHWKKFVDIAIQETWLAFEQKPQLFQTEDDVKCYLYNELQKVIKVQPYAVHAEVTHRAEHQNNGGYRFRDLVLLNPTRIWNNAFDNPIEGIHGIRNSGFSHIGESIFFEIKFQRIEGVRIIEDDPENLITYQYQGGEDHPKYAILIWVSKHGFYGEYILEEQMRESLQRFSDNVIEPHIPFEHVFGFVFNNEQLYEIKRDGNNWISNRISPE